MQKRESNVGSKRIDPLILFKMLVLQPLFNLSVGVRLPLAVEELEFQVNDRRSFEELVGIGVMNGLNPRCPNCRLLSREA
jgi:transposase, IS5 family